MSDRHPHSATKSLLIFLLALCPFCWTPAASAEVTYRFERMWPTLQQPWDFSGPCGVAVDSSGSVYVVDTKNCRIQKFTSSGALVTQWGSYGSGDGQFSRDPVNGLPGPQGVAVDTSGNVYVADAGNGRIQRFTSDGIFVTKWGTWGSGNGQFISPYGVAVDSSGNVYVTDPSNHHIQKFTTDGTFVTKWGSLGFGDGLFYEPRGVAVDASDNVYVANSGHHQIQKFTSNGAFVTKWGSQGSGDGLFSRPEGVAADSSGNVYVVDYGNQRIQKFTSSGAFVTKWGSRGSGNGQFGTDPNGSTGPVAVAVDGSGSLYVADTVNDCIQKFTSDGTFVAKWGSYGYGDSYFQSPHGVAVDSSGNVYVADIYNHRIQKFTSDGTFVTQWGGWGSGDGQFYEPYGVGVDASGNVYVADTQNHRVQKFTSHGTLVTQWGSQGFRDGQFYVPCSVAVDGAGNVYVADSGNNRIQKFTPSGTFVMKWRVQHPYGAAMDSSGNVYVADTDNHQIQKFTSDGTFVTKWGSEGSGVGQFESPWGVAVDSSSNVYVADTYNHRIQKFTSSGTFVTKWGSHGSWVGEFVFPFGVTVDSSGNVYVADTNNHRIQKFRPVTPVNNSKAIVVAGGGPFVGNSLWDATQMCANFAYRTLNCQGNTKKTTYCLSSNTQLDLDNNGLADDVDGDATNANLQYALTQWAGQQLGGLPTGDLVVYLVDHGGTETFRMSGTETLDALALAGWLATAQAGITGKLTVIYDACKSGSFQSFLAAPNRTIITSTSPGQDAHFVSQGSISFSSLFWTHIFNGLDIRDAFTLTSESLALAVSGQTPLLDANGNGTANEADDLIRVQNVYIGNGTVIAGSAPIIGSVCAPHTVVGASSALLYADGVTDSDGIAGVWAVLRPPDYVPRASGADNPILNLPSIDLQPTTQEGRWEATYRQFNVRGTYQIAIYARDQIGNVSVPKVTSLSVDSPLRRRAVIVAGGAASDQLWPWVEGGATLAYDALRFQSYLDEDVYFLCPETISTGVDGTPVSNNLEYSLTEWARQQTQDLTLYLIGDGEPGTFRLNATETLTVVALDGWLDELQAALSGTVTVIYDASYSGSFLSALQPPAGKTRILVSSAASGEAAQFLSNGNISFSRYFWRAVANGTTVSRAMEDAALSTQFIGRAVTAQLDDSGNGIGNEKGIDGRIARAYLIGSGIVLAGDNPLIGSTVPDQTIGSATSATIWVSGVTTTGTISRVWAVITPPDNGRTPSAPVEIDLQATTPNRYEVTYTGFNLFGTYEIAVFASGNQGSLSLPAHTRVLKNDGPDAYEIDDTKEQATWIGLDGPTQRHNFHVQGDQDCVAFYVSVPQGGSTVITLETLADTLGPRGDTLITLYGPGGNELDSNDDRPGGASYSSFLEYTATQSGLYYTRVMAPSTNSVFGPDTQYDLRVYRPVMPATPGSLVGVVRNAVTHAGVSGADIKIPALWSGGRWQSLAQGNYLVACLDPGTYSIEVSKAGYHTATRTVSVAGGNLPTQHDIDLTPDVVSVPVLTVTPLLQNVSALAGTTTLRGTTTFDVSNAGGGDMQWQAAVQDGAGWLRITSGASGTKSGTIEVEYDANRDRQPRTATIRVTAAGAANSPCDVTVAQAFCRADIDGKDGVNAVDVQTVINGALQLSTGGLDADIDHDGAVNAVDIQLVINAALGL